jgi:hypothetical protein
VKKSEVKISLDCPLTWKSQKTTTFLSQNNISLHNYEKRKSGIFTVRLADKSLQSLETVHKCFVPLDAKLIIARGACSTFVSIAIIGLLAHHLQERLSVVTM